jgi:hypothetical protein
MHKGNFHVKKCKTFQVLAHEFVAELNNSNALLKELMRPKLNLPLMVINGSFHIMPRVGWCERMLYWFKDMVN